MIESNLLYIHNPKIYIQQYEKFKVSENYKKNWEKKIDFTKKVVKKKIIGPPGQ